ncbi:MAG: YicC family protein [Duncaniella sp.]|nr:YicC family protein [Duncaniella sp.]
MLYSMTGFGKAVTELPDKKITVEIKSLNSKQVDMAARVPSQLREVELELRNRVATGLVRGKIDLTVSIENIGPDTNQVSLNTQMLESYKKQVEEVSDKLGIGVPTDWYQVLLRFPDVMKTETQTELSAEDVEAVFATLSSAIEAVKAHRRAEGEKLEAFFRLRLDRISALLADVPRHEGERVARIRARMEEGLQKLQGVDFDRSRLEQEMFFYIEKLDVNEEKQRLAQHISYFDETMREDDAQGKKLGFIAQEMGREINTLGSKSNHSEMQHLVVMMKDELEQIKEQVLNVM